MAHTLKKVLYFTTEEDFHAFHFLTPCIFHNYYKCLKTERILLNVRGKAYRTLNH
jgi:hypothetical protein